MEIMYPYSHMMLHKRGRTLVYGDVKKVITEEIKEVDLIKYLMGGK